MDHEPESVARALRALRHRGPDGEGSYRRAGVTLGQTRLQIVGTAARGAQPIHDDGYALVFNGEIHNYRELAREIGAPAVSDTEVLFALLRLRGAGALPRLRGFWALAFVDFGADTVLVARDRYGQKPLLYARRGSGWAFASEAPALGVPLEPSRPAVMAFAASGHYPGATGTFFREIRQLRPGHYATLAVDGGEGFTEVPYYRPPPPGASDVPTFAEAAGALDRHLRESLQLRLRADVPVGLTLSAGKDSGTLAALLPTGVRDAFAFDNQAADTEATEVSAWYGHRFDVHVSRLGGDEEAFGQQVRRMHGRLDAPLASGSLLALDGLYRDARRRGVPVVLSGQGADEVLGGYNYYAELQPNRLAAALARTWTIGGPRALWLARRDRRAAGDLLGSFTPPAIAKPDSAPDVDALGARQRSDLLGPPLQTMLWYEDRLAMAHSIEARYPFLDVDLVDYCLSLPSEYHVRWFSRKRLLYAAFAKTWPAALRRQRRKRGLPAAEARLLSSYPEWTATGLRAGGEYLSTALAPEMPVGPRHAKALFRLATVGHWLRLFG